MQREHQEGPSPTRFYDDGHESGVDGTKGTVPGDSGDTDVVIALVILHRLSKDVAELALPNNTPAHGWGKDREYQSLEARWSLILRAVEGRSE